MFLFLSSDHHPRVGSQLVFIPVAVSSVGAPQVDVTIKYKYIHSKYFAVSDWLKAPC